MWTFAKRAIIEDTISLSEIIISYVAVVGALALVRKSRTVDAEEVTSVSYEVRIYLRGEGVVATPCTICLPNFWQNG